MWGSIASSTNDVREFRAVAPFGWGCLVGPTNPDTT